MLHRLLLMVCLALPVLAQAEDTNPDPWEGFNRKVFVFNDTLDRYILLPATKAYKAVTPDLVEAGVHNFIGNLSDVVSFFSNVLQLKLDASLLDFSRVAFNSTFGLAGLIDVATAMGIPEHKEDVGQALGYWGVGPGPFVVVPFLGPRNVRDGLAIIPDNMLHPMSSVNDPAASLGYTVLNALDTRANLMDKEKLISGDRYAFIRDAYMQRREFLVKDGQIDDIYGDDGF